jgi:hypothetical protein
MKWLFNIAYNPLIAFYSLFSISPNTSVKASCQGLGVGPILFFKTLKGGLGAAAPNSWLLIPLTTVGIPDCLKISLAKPAQWVLPELLK